MSQLDLWPDCPSVAQSTTSRLAAKAAAPRAKRIRDRLLAAFMDIGSHGLTDEEAQARLDLPGNSQRPRRRELERLRIIVPSGRTRPTASGRLATVWVLNRGSNIA